MTDVHAVGAETGTGDRPRPRAVLPALCVTQITSWGIVSYAVPVLNPRITAATGWSATSTTASFPVPELHQHPDQPYDLIAAADRPVRLTAVRAHRHQVVHLPAVGHVRVGDAALEPPDGCAGPRRAGKD